MKEYKTLKYKRGDIYVCECGKQFTKPLSLSSHFGHCEEHHKVLGYEVCNYHKNHKGCMSGWDKKSKEELIKIHETASETLKERIKNGTVKTFWQRPKSETIKQRRSISEKISKLRIEHKVPCKGKSGYYKNIHCDSSWELAYVIYCIDHDIDIKRCNIRFKYMYNNTECTYTPDFIINGSEIVEIKGFKYDRWKNKLKICTENNITVIDCEGIKKYLEYTINKYGKHFIDLYEKDMILNNKL